MTKTRSTKRALLLSALSLLMCVSMLIGSTFAWFTDSVTSAGNIIQSGTLDVTMEWADGKTDPANTTWTDASEGAIFNSKLWEPGYTEVRHIKIANEGTLALKYQLNIVANGEVSELADVIDVYYVDPAVQVADRTALTDANKLGTLTQVLDNISTTASGNLKATEKDTITLALKMQESAGNEYQSLAIGSDFSIQLLATQLASESDSFDNQYDKDAEYPVVVANAAQLQDALNAGQNVVLNNDIDSASSITIPAGITSKLDLNGHSITTTAGQAINNKGTLTIEGDGVIKGGSYGVFNMSGTLYLNGGTYEGSTYGVAANNNCVINGNVSDSSFYGCNINGGTVTNCTFTGFTTYGGTFIGCTFDSNGSYQGGTFDFNPSEEGYVPFGTVVDNGNGTWTIVIE